jgi:two-component system cell cycle sensor histidine kinase/response regulator CckA
MLVMITFELLCLWLSIGTLSSVRAYVGGEGLWAKAQKDASYSLRKYAQTHDHGDYRNFLNFMKVPLGDRKARIELTKALPDFSVIRQGFLEGRNHDRDIDGMSKLFRRFHRVSYMARAISIWTEADHEIGGLETLGSNLNKMITSGKPSRTEINETLAKIDLLNNKLTKLEDNFSFTLGEASRWMAYLLLRVLLSIALTIEISALMLTVLFTRRISKGIDEINSAAIKVAGGNFDAKVQVNSNDELGYLANTFNRMTDALEQNITGRKKSEQSFKESEELFKSAFNYAPIGIALISLQGQFLRVNQGLCKILGYSEEELLEKSFLEITYPEDIEISNDVIKYLKSKGTTQASIEKRYIDKKGGIIWVRVNSSLHCSIDGAPLYFITHTEEITEQKKAEIKLYEQAALLDKAQDAIIVSDLNYYIIYWNKSAERLYGWTEAEAVSKKITELFTEWTIDFSEAQERFLKKGEWVGELKQFTKSGAELMVQSRWTLIHDKTGVAESILTVNTDITEKKKLETQFFHSQRLESIGTLSSGIAHDLNNILTPIMLSLQLLRMEIPAERRKGVLDTLETLTHRGSDIIKQLLIFGSGIKGNKEDLEANPLISEVINIISETFPKSITIEKNIPESLWFVSGDKTQLQQVLLNLFVNARDEMSEGGTLKISAENITTDENFVRLHHEAEIGLYVCFETIDTGRGIPPEIIEKIFEPFFTTKEIGKGSGLGLSIVLGIVKSHRGFVRVESQAGKGTRFKIYIPAVKSAQAGKEEMENLPLSLGNGELILVVDDEPSNLEMTKSILETFNYSVLTACNGLEAVQIYESNKERVKVILTDLNMPAMDGFTLIKTLDEINSDTRIIASSGLMNTRNKSEFAGLNVKSFLQKPYTSEKLLKKINEVLK